MSIKRMVTKLALAFAAKKGMEALRGAGGIRGLQASLSGTPQPSQEVDRGGMSGRIGGASDARTGGLGNLLSSLGMSGAADNGEAGMAGQGVPTNTSLGALLGSLAASFGGQNNTSSPAQANTIGSSDPVREEDAAPVLRAMVQMARADGTIDEDEQSALFDILNDATESEKDAVNAALREPVDASAIARDTPHRTREEVYSAALLIGDPDTDKERSFLQALARGLDLEQHDLDRLHSAMGKPRLVFS